MTNEIHDMHIELAILVDHLSKKPKYCFTNRKPKTFNKFIKEDQENVVDICSAICSTSFIHRLLCQKLLSMHKWGFFFSLHDAFVG